MLTNKHVLEIKELVEEIVKWELELKRVLNHVERVRNKFINYLFDISNPSNNSTSNQEN